MGFLQEFSPQVSQAARAKPAPAQPRNQAPVVVPERSGKSRGFVFDFGQSVPEERFEPAYVEPTVDAPHQEAAIVDVWVPAEMAEEDVRAPGAKPSSSFSGFLGMGTSMRRTPARRRSSSPAKTARPSATPVTPSRTPSTAGLERRLDELSSRAKEASGRIRSAESRRESLKLEYSQKLDQLRAAKDQLNDLKQREDQTEEKLSRQSKLVRRLERKLSAAMGWGQDYYSSSSSFDFEMSDLDLSYKDGKLTSDSRWRLSEFLDTKRNQQSQTSSSLSRTRDAIRDCESRVSRLQSQLEQISGEQERASQRSESTQRKKAALEQELQRLQDRHFDVSGTFY